MFQRIITAALAVAVSFSVALAADECCKNQKLSALGADGGGGGYTPRVAGVRHGNTGYAGLRTAGPGTQNLVVCVGGSADGSEEHDYAKAIHKIVGGAMFEGVFGQDDLVAYIVRLGRARTKVANVYFCGHINLFLADNADTVKVLRERDPQLAAPIQNMYGFLNIGRGARDAVGLDHFANLGDAFTVKLDAALKAANLTPGDVFASDVRLVFRVCSTNVFMRPFFDQLAARVPVGGEIVAYDQPYVWITGRTNLPRMFWSYVRPEQTGGRVLIPGTWRPAPPPAPAAVPPMAAGPGGPAQPRERIGLLGIGSGGM